MRGKLFITISDSREVRQYSVNRTVGKLLVFLLSGHTLLFLAGFLGLAWLAWEIDALRFARQMLNQEMRQEADARSRFADKARAEMQRIEETLRRKREELGIMNEVAKPVPDRPVGRDGKPLSSSPLFQHFLPVGAPTPGVDIASSFGMRPHPVLHRMAAHNGVDFDVPPGTPVQVTADGVVQSARDEGDGYGLSVVVRHPYGFNTVYGHLQAVKVTAGQVVKKGSVVALSGNSGLSSGPHVHYEVRYEKAAVDPAPFVRSEADPSRLFQRNRRIPWASLVAYHRP